MKNYFVNLNEQVAELAQVCDETMDGNRKLLNGIMAIEQPMINDCLTVATDGETPDDVCRAIVGLVEAHRVRYANGSFMGDENGPCPAADYAVAKRCSSLIGEMANLFSKIFGMRYKVRYGVMSFLPTTILQARKVWEDAHPNQEPYDGPRPQEPFVYEIPVCAIPVERQPDTTKTFRKRAGRTKADTGVASAGSGVSGAGTNPNPETGHSGGQQDLPQSAARTTGDTNSAEGKENNSMNNANARGGLAAEAAAGSTTTTTTAPDKAAAKAAAKAKADADKAAKKAAAEAAKATEAAAKAEKEAAATAKAAEKQAAVDAKAAEKKAKADAAAAEKKTKADAAKAERKAKQEAAKAAKAAAKANKIAGVSTGGKLGGIFGFSSVSVVRAAAAAGANVEGVIAVLKTHKITMSESTLRQNFRQGKNGSLPGAKLTPEQVKEFTDASATAAAAAKATEAADKAKLEAEAAAAKAKTEAAAAEKAAKVAADKAAKAAAKAAKDAEKAAAKAAAAVTTPAPAAVAA